MGCCFYDLCGPSREIYGKQSGGEQCGIPRLDKHSLTVCTRTRKEGGVEGRTEKEKQWLGAGVQGVEGWNQMLDPVCAHTTGPASEPPAGRVETKP